MNGFFTQRSIQSADFVPSTRKHQFLKPCIVGISPNSANDQLLGGGFKYFVLTPAEMVQFDEHIFQMG